jgi:hypothetical protein
MICIFASVEKSKAKKKPFNFNHIRIISCLQAIGLASLSHFFVRNTAMAKTVIRNICQKKKKITEL